MEKTEIETRPATPLPDAEDLQLSDPMLSYTELEQRLVTLWTQRFTKAENFRRPFIDRNLRLYRLYRAYRQAVNYAYKTSLMPPIGFEIIETIKPRLASSEVEVNILPKTAAAVNSGALKEWENLVWYNLQETDFEEKKIDWVDDMLKGGNGTMQLMWMDDRVELEVVDGFLFYPDPQAGPRLRGSRYEIKQSFKTKAEIEKDEKARGDNPLYIVEVKGETKISVVDTPAIWDKIDDEQPRADDPRRDRYMINTRKMGQIDNGSTKPYVDEGESGTPDKAEGERQVEIWECFDHVDGKLTVIMNRTKLVRYEDNPYAEVNNGQVFIDLPNIRLAHEYHAIPTLEPVETTIHEIADSRNQAMDDIVFSLDPIRKVKKGLGYKDTDFVHSPGATWYLKNVDDITFEKMPEVSRAWVEKDGLLRREIQSTLALSEYTQGSPASAQEPSSKVEVLLMQTSIRFSLLVRQMETAITDVVNSMIQMHKTFGEGAVPEMRLKNGKEVQFATFEESSREAPVDAVVTVSPKREKGPAQEQAEVLQLYKMFVVEDKPEPTDQKAMEAWTKKKNALQRMVLDKMGYPEYIDILAPEMKEEEVAQETKAPDVPTPPEGAPQMMPPELPQDYRAMIPAPAEILPLEQGGAPAPTPPSGGGGLREMLGKLLKR